MGVSLPTGFPVLAVARWCEFSGPVAEIQMIPADVPGCGRVVGGVAAAVPGARAAAGL